MHSDRGVGNPHFSQLFNYFVQDLFSLVLSAGLSKGRGLEDTKLALDVGFDVVSCSCCSRCS